MNENGLILVFYLVLKKYATGINPIFIALIFDEILLLLAIPFRYTQTHIQTVNRCIFRQIIQF